MFVIKDKSQVSPQILGSQNKSSNQGKVERGRVKDSLGSAKMKYFSFRMFNNKAKTV